MTMVEAFVRAASFLSYDANSRSVWAPGTFVQGTYANDECTNGDTAIYDDG